MNNYNSIKHFVEVSFPDINSDELMKTLYSQVTTNDTYEKFVENSSITDKELMVKATKIISDMQAEMILKKYGFR